MGPCRRPVQGRLDRLSRADKWLLDAYETGGVSLGEGPHPRQFPFSTTGMDANPARAYELSIENSDATERPRQGIADIVRM